MLSDSIKASCSILRTGSFFFILLTVPTVLSAAEVTRSLSLEDRIRILEQQLSTGNRMRAESQFEITNLKNEIRSLNGLVEEQGYQLEQIINRQRELYRDIDSRLPQSTVTSEPESTENYQYADTIKSTDSSTESDTQPPVLDDAQIRANYDKIFPLVRSKRYDDAIKGYQQFIAEYPDSIFVSNSRYWLAQIYSVQGRTDEAEREYLNVAQQFPTSNKAADAWYKLGLLYIAQNQTDKAIDAFNQVVTQYSDTTSAQMAVSRLQDLKSSN
jgi:tol-pal system protein YbgF